MLGIKPSQKLHLEDFLNRPPLTHLKRLTTEIGIIQHADGEVPDPSFGYSIDDNARAIIVCLWFYKIFNDPSLLRLFDIYFSYIKKVRIEYGTFHNFLSFTEQILDAEGSQDSIARAIWSLGVTVALHPDEKIRDEALEIVKGTKVDKHHLEKNIRTKAYILLGLADAFKNGEILSWADDLEQAYKENKTDDWFWFEDSLRYANGILPYAMVKAFKKTRKRKYLNIAKESFDWLDENSRKNGVLVPIGQNGWYFKGQVKALYDQQPLEAADMVIAACGLYEITKDKAYLNKAIEWMGWYYGNNLQKLHIFNTQTKGVNDALVSKGLNTNQGAESIVTFLMAYLSISKIAYQLKANNG